MGLNRLYIEMDDGLQAEKAALEALQIGRAIQNPETIAGALAHLGHAELILGEVGTAEACFEEAYALCKAPDWQQHIYAGLACLGIGVISLSRHDYERAHTILREGLERTKIAVIKLWLLDVLAGVIGTTDDVFRAATIWGATEALNEKMGTVAAPSDRRRSDALIKEARSRINLQTFQAAWAEGRELSLDQVIALAMV
jgi:tetratricopeptide (TPR) repeat protein